MSIHVVGMGYTGQTLAAVLADVGFKVYGSDVDDTILGFLEKGESHVVEDGLDRHVKRHMNKNWFVGKPTVNSKQDVSAHIVCVHTPVDEKTKEPNLEQVRSAFEEIATDLKKGQLVVLRSTAPVGTTRNFVKPILESKSGLKAGEDFYLVFAPERTTQGNALKELRTLPQIIGGINDESINEAVKIFGKITPTITRVSSVETAELIKLLDNSYRDTMFAYAQEIAMYCEKAGINAFEVIKAANQHYPRNNIPLPSPGVGGVCLNKDPHILLDCAKKVGVDMKLIRASREINKNMPRKVAEDLKKHDIKGKKVCILGFAFKGHPETNDTRESPTLDLVKHIAPENAQLFGYDPVVEKWKMEKTGVTVVNSIQEGVNGADVVVLMTNHPSFAKLHFTEALSTMKKGGVVYDGWGLLRRQDVEELGLRYEGVGVG